MASLIAIVSLSTCTIAGTKDMLKKELLLQMRTFQLVQFQSGNSLKKTSSGTKDVYVIDSVETFSWVKMKWEKNECDKYSYDGSGRITQVSMNLSDNMEMKMIYKYDPDRITIRETSIFDLNVGEDFFSSETSYTVMKYYPGYTNEIIQGMYGNDAALLKITGFSNNINLDSTTMTYGYRDKNGIMDTSSNSSTKYIKQGNVITGAYISNSSKTIEGGAMKYYANYFNSGNGIVDTFKCILHFDSKLDSLYEQFYLKMQFNMTTSKKNEQGSIVELITAYGHDSSFSDCNENQKINYFYNSSGEIDSSITHNWDTLQNVWKKSMKSVYSYKKINAGINNSIIKLQNLPKITSEWKNGTLYLAIPDGITVASVEQLDLLGKIILKFEVANTSKTIILRPNSTNTNGVFLVRLDTNIGELFCKVTSINNTKYEEFNGSR
jgi:hypothetical protein